MAQERELAVKPRYVQGQYSEIDEATGDTIYHIIFKNLTVFPEHKFKNKKEEEFYWRTVRDVKKALPYAKLICRTLTETYEYIETLPDTKAREKHLNDMEKEVFNQYKPELKKFTRTQARVLVKLIQRETNQSSYEIIKAFLGSFRAGFWQAFGKMFGVSLKGQYRPETDDKDAIIERICIEVEQGTL
ncbi:MAG: DUF4294 domain-containing protein [Muribaculaceae bacterium]|nr:DUF4294 domain-containing protein [Muribaculaceae bacterium]MDE7110695.1 DUF4294 domain-containing protein [Muribaculaceae bacterium]